MRRLTTLLLLLTTALFTQAQSWNAVDERQFNDETIVYARLATGDAATDDDATRFRVGAFIGDECRGAADATLGDDGHRLYVIRVHGDRDADPGKPMQFLVYDRTNDYDHEATPSRQVLFTGESEGTPSNPILLTFDARYEPLQGFRVSVDALAAGETGQMVLTPIPADATYHAADINISFTGTPAHWQAVDVRSPLLHEGTGEALTITPLIPGRINVTFSGIDVPFYDATGTQPFTSFAVAYPVHLNEGWQWLTNCYGDVTAATFESVYHGDALTEIRTQDHLLYNDPQWGYFGTLMEEGLQRNTAYKVLMASGPATGRIWEGSLVDGLDFAVDGMWTWTPSPYYYDRPLSEMVSATPALPVGMVLVAKERGSAEWDGTQWVGDLSVVPAGESLLCYNPTESPLTMQFASELGQHQPLSPGLTPYPPASPPTPLSKRRGGTPERGNSREGEAYGNNPNDNRGAYGNSPWHYDARPFIDNMTMVVSMPELALASDYSLGAFVGSECRGEGRYVDGLFFVTVHGRQGERVSFRLCHLPTGQQYRVDETITGERRMGSLRQPLVLHSEEQVTGIAYPQPLTDEAYPQPLPEGRGAAVYDAAGRTLAPSHGRGVHIVRYSDNSVRKILQK
ncbi:MAG: hypothetical protein II949_12555 [Prevotella sp.]|nr:hypothetical protein [Prevotella sp.]MBQ6194138.1 hypothetical protein [Prevotella sp.]